MKKWLNFKTFFYVSLIVPVILLYQGGYFQTIDIISWPAFAGSILLLLLGMFLQMLAWKSLMDHASLKLNFRDAFVSVFLPILAKYIPGKVVQLHGVAAYLRDYKGYPRKTVGALFVLYNLIYIFSGLLIGGFVVPRLNESWWSLYLIGGGVGILILLFFNRFIQTLWKWAQRVFSRLPDMEEEVKASPGAIIYFLIQWGIFGCGFALMVYSMGIEINDYIMILAYPLAVSMGNLAIFAPGGLGIRESLLVVLLLTFGYTLEEGTSISGVTRIWSLIGELTFFFIAFVLHRQGLKQGQEIKKEV